MKLKRSSKGRRKRLKIPRVPGRPMRPRLGLFEKRLQD